jgi:hypothetical protein
MGGMVGIVRMHFFGAKTGSGQESGARRVAGERARVASKLMPCILIAKKLEKHLSLRCNESVVILVFEKTEKTIREWTAFY